MTAPRRSRRSAVRAFGPALAWTGLLFVATSLPGGAIRTPGPSWLDKGAHFGFYLVLAVLWRRAVRRSSPPARRDGRRPIAAGWLLLAALAIFAGLDELHQAWIPGRSPSLADWAADLAGIAVGTWLEARRTGGSRAGSAGNPDRRARDGG